MTQSYEEFDDEFDETLSLLHENHNGRSPSTVIIVTPTPTEGGGDDDASTEIPAVAVASVSWRKYIGLSLAIISALSFALNTICCQVLVKNYSVYLVSFVRGVGLLIPSVLCALHARYMQGNPIFDPITFSDIRTLIAILGRGLLGVEGLIAVNGATKLIGTGDTLVLKSFSPLLVGFFASCCLNDKLTMVLIICGIQVLLGVICIAKPPFITGHEDYNVDTLYGTLLALSVALAAALGIICISYSKKLHFSIVNISMGFLICVICGGICLGTDGFTIPMTGWDWLLFVAIAACTAITQIFMVLALKFVSAGSTSLVRTTEVIFGYVLEITCLGVVPDATSWIGAVIVLLAVFIALANGKG